MSKSTLDTFMELFEGALGNPRGRAAFINFVRQLSGEERVELMAEAERYGQGSQIHALESIFGKGIEGDGGPDEPVN